MSAEASDDLTEGESSGNADCAGGTDICLEANGRAGKIPPTEDETNLKKANMRILIERYFYQLLEGCENKSCRNRHCKSSGQVPVLTPNQAAAKALQLFFQGASLCQNDKIQGEQRLTEHSQRSILRRDEESSSSSNNNNSSLAICDNVSKAQRGDATIDVAVEASPRRASVVEGSKKSKEVIDENIILTALSEGLDDPAAFSQLIHKLGIAFSTVENIAGSFQVKEKAPLDHILDRASQMKLNEGLKTLTKEQLRTLEDDQDKDEDSCAGKTPPVVELHTTKIDFPSVRRTFRHLFALPDLEKRNRVISTLNSVLGNLVECMPFDLQCTMSSEKVENIITASIVILDVICLARRDFKDDLVIGTCETMSHMELWAAARVARIWAVHCTEHFQVLLELMQDLISCQVVNTMEFDGEGEKIEDNDTILHVVKTMKVLYYANILAGDYERTRRKEEDSDLRYLGLEYDDEEDQFLGASNDDSMMGGQKLNLFPADPLAVELDVGVMDSRQPLMPFSEFYNEVLSEALEMDQDYLNYYNIRMLSQDLDGDHDSSDVRLSKTSFMIYPFVLTPMKKTLAMYFHSRIRMYSEGRISILHNHISGQPINPYLKLKVRRDHLIEDALIELELIAVNNAKDLKKQLVVEFIGEQGVDEGGVSKEFFQLIVEQIFNPEYGMFLHHEDSEMFWINSTSFENDAQFSLIGIVLGLAIYNNIILSVSFPMVIYRKLMGIKGSFGDLSDWNPNLYNSLLKMLQDDESEFEDVYMQTFEITYKDVFENVISHELKEKGASLMVTQDNKREFVELYADFLLNESIEKQFKAFRKGFQMVMGAESPLNMLFRPDEVELLVCGSKQFDVTQLHKATEYENGYSAETRIIKDFWEVVYEMPIELQRKLLEFSTGSDRVPIGGLSNLKLVIARHGPDSDRLPTSHTCYNILLLPEYDTKEKLKDRLLKAINFSKGFGML